jgi:hypothetical protein
MLLYNFGCVGQIEVSPLYDFSYRCPTLLDLYVA